MSRIVSTLILIHLLSLYFPQMELILTRSNNLTFEILAVFQRGEIVNKQPGEMDSPIACIMESRIFRLSLKIVIFQ